MRQEDESNTHHWRKRKKNEEKQSIEKRTEHKGVIVEGRVTCVGMGVAKVGLLVALVRERGRERKRVIPRCMVECVRKASWNHCCGGACVEVWARVQSESRCDRVLFHSSGVLPTPDASAAWVTASRWTEDG